MQKKILSLTLALVLAFSMALGAAAAPRFNSTLKAEPKLSFSGTKATCSLEVTALKGSSISAELMLYKVVNGRNVAVQSWSKSGTTTLDLSGTCTVVRGQEYLLAATITVDGPNGTDDIYKEVSVIC